MTERWQRELGKITTLRAPSRVKTRIEQGPVGHGGPPAPSPGQRIAAGLVAFAVFAGAAALALGAFGNDGSPAALTGPAELPPVVVTFEVHGQTNHNEFPSATMKFDGRTSEGTVISYGWGDEIRDTVMPEFGDGDYMPVWPSAPLVIDGTAKSVTGSLRADGTFPFEEIVPLDPAGGQPTLPSEEGRYVLEFTPVWEQGAVTFYFPIEVISPPTPPPSDLDPSVLVATLEAPEDGSMPGLTFQYGDEREKFFAQGGRWPGVNGFILPLLSFSPTLEPGATIRIEGDAAEVTGTLEVRDQRIPLDLSAGVGTLPDEASSYRLTLKGTWDRGTAEFYVNIQVGAPVTDEPSAPPLDASPTSPSDPVRLDGVPFPVCRPVSIPGHFTDALDTVWVFEEERVPDAGCVNSEGFQHVGVGTPSGVDFFSDRLTMGLDSVSMWPYGSPDLNGDGLDEIALGLEGSRQEGYAHLILFTVHVTDQTVVPVILDCGPAYNPAPWVSVRGPETQDDRGGSYCGELNGDRGFVRWWIDPRSGALEAALWQLEGDTLRSVTGSTLEEDPSGPLPDGGFTQLCGSAVYWSD